MNKILLLFLIVGLYKTIDAYCVNSYEPIVAVYAPSTYTTCASPSPCMSCSTPSMPCSTPCMTCSTPSMPCSTPSMPCSTSSTPCSSSCNCLSESVKACAANLKSCDGGCNECPECRCLKALTNFPDVEYPTMCNVGIKPCYY